MSAYTTNKKRGRGKGKKQKITIKNKKSHITNKKRGGKGGRRGGREGREVAVRVADCLGMGGEGGLVMDRPGKKVVGEGAREG